MKASDVAKRKTARGDAVLSTRTDEFYTVLGEIGASVYIAPMALRTLSLAFVLMLPSSGRAESDESFQEAATQILDAT